MDSQRVLAPVVYPVRPRLSPPHVSPKTAPANAPPDALPPRTPGSPPPGSPNRLRENGLHSKTPDAKFGSRPLKGMIRDQFHPISRRILQSQPAVERRPPTRPRKRNRPLQQVCRRFRQIGHLHQQLPPRPRLAMLIRDRHDQPRSGPRTPQENQLRSLLAVQRLKTDEACVELSNPFPGRGRSGHSHVGNSQNARRVHGIGRLTVPPAER